MNTPTELSIEPGETSPASELRDLCAWIELSCADIENDLGSNPLAIRVMELRHMAKKVGEVVEQEPSK